MSSEAPAPAPSPSSGPAPAPAPVNGGFGFGVAYAPFRADGTCKSEAEVKQDINALSSYSVIRLYGVECNMISNVLSAVQDTQQIWAGIYDVDKVDEQAASLIAQVSNRWNKINTVNVGNEHVQTGKASVDQVTGAIGHARNLLRYAGYNGPVVTVDTMIAMKENIALCTASDFCAINCHAFFDGNVEAKDAGSFVLKWVQEISTLAGGKRTVVAESGWPSSGGNNKAAIPAKSSQEAAIGSLKDVFQTDLILYSAFDNVWLQDNAATFGVEKHWGIYGLAPSA